MERMKNNLDLVDVELIEARRTIVDMIKPTTYLTFLRDWELTKDTYVVQTRHKYKELVHSKEMASMLYHIERKQKRETNYFLC
jgi:hypothetical protein